MASRLKEDEKNERAIRGLLKLPENRRCINCNSLGPQYVCTNFWTFVCTTCSGIHREFTHRVKSVSMAKFTAQEVSSLQEGGNKRAKEIYFKEWDSQRNSVPDSSNVERLRDFVKHVYVDRRFSGERNFDKPPPRAKMGDKEDSNENRRADRYQGGSRSPPYEDTYERRYSDRSSPGGRSYGERSPGYSPGGRSYGERSPGYVQESRQYGDYKKSPARSDVVNDWRREDRFGNGRGFEDRRMSDGDAKLEGRSPERSKDLDTPSPPMARPVREILGDSIVPLRISKPPTGNGGKIADISVQAQKTASSSSLGSSNGNPAEVKWESSGSLIDFDADPEPPVAAVASQVQQPATVQADVIPSNDNNWASFDFSPETKATQASSNSLGSVLSQLSAPASVPDRLSGLEGGIGAQTTGHAVSNLLSVGGDAAVGPAGHTLPFSAVTNSSLSTFAPGGAPATVPGLMQMLPANGSQWPNLQHQQPSMYPAGGNQTNFTPFGGTSSNQVGPYGVSSSSSIVIICLMYYLFTFSLGYYWEPWSSSSAPNAQGPSSTPLDAPPVQDLTSDVSQIKSSERKVLPEDLFSMNYASMPVPVPGWHGGPAHGMGFSMQYNTGVTLSTFSQSSQSTNPFDVGNEPPQVQAPAFPSMMSMQGALPNVPPPSNLHRTSSLGTPSPTWVHSQPSTYASAMAPQALPYASALPPQAPSYASAMPPRPYMGQMPTNLLPSRPQGLGGFPGEGTSFGSLNSDQQMPGRYSAPATPDPYSSVGGNPFG